MGLRSGARSTNKAEVRDDDGETTRAKEQAGWRSMDTYAHSRLYNMFDVVPADLRLIWA